VALVVLVALTAWIAPRATGATAAKQYAYRVQATYALSRDVVDPATGLRVFVERRLEAELRLWAKSSEDMVYTGIKGDNAVADGKAVATVRDERSSCSQTIEAKGRVSLEYETSRAPLSGVKMSWNPGGSPRLPSLPCGAPEILEWRDGTRVRGDHTWVTGGLVVHEIRRFDADVYARLAGGRDATFEASIPSPRQTPGTTERATIQLVFTRSTDPDPKPAPSSGKPVAVSKPVVSVRRHTASLVLIVTRKGDPTGVRGATCTGSFVGGRPPLYGSPTALASHARRLHPLFRRAYPGLPKTMGWTTVVQCGFEHEEYTKACGKVLRGSVRVVVDGTRTIAKPFSFVWRAKGYPC
jgi:hypothetical protein